MRDSPAGLRSEANVSTVLMRSSDSNVIDYADGISLSPCRVIELKAPQGEYSLVINEKGTNRQFTYQIEAKVSSTTFTAASTTTVPVFADPPESAETVYAAKPRVWRYVAKTVDALTEEYVLGIYVRA